MRVLVTGGSGFVGSALVGVLARRQGVAVVAALRNGNSSAPAGVSKVLIHGVDSRQDWNEALLGVDVVVHCAARVHVMRERSADPLAEFRQVNVDGTMRLATQAALQGVKRFIYLSSIKVNGEQTMLGHPFVADGPLSPMDPYGISKMEAENGLRSLARETGMDVVIIRPPLVYGPGVKANFLAMMRWLKRGVPLPFGAVTGNRRSLVALDNLTDLIAKCLEHPGAANQAFLVSDGESLSTAALLRRMGDAMGRPARLFPVPVRFLRIGATLLGKSDLAERLCGSLEVDIGKTKELLDWAPPIDLDGGLRRAAAYSVATAESVWS